MQEAELIRHLQNGNEAAFQKLVALYGDRLYNTALSFLQSSADAEDAVQEVFIKAFRGIGSFKAEASLSTWLYRIAVAHSLDVLRKKKRQRHGSLLQGLFGRKEEGMDAPDFHHPGVAAEKKEAAAVLFKAVRQLPASQQTAFLLQKTESLSQAEIAAIMKISVSAVESLLQRAKTSLRHLLGDYYQTHYQ